MRGFKTAKSLLRKALCSGLAGLSIFAVGFGAFAQGMDVPELLEPVGVVTDTAIARIGEISDIDVYEAFVRPHVEGVAFQVSGTVEQVHVTVGQPVKKGEALITLDQEIQKDRMESLERQIDELRISGDYEARIFELDRSILELELEMLMVRSPDDKDTIASRQMEIEAFDLEWELSRDLRRLEFARLEEELAALESQMVQSVITAPFDGNIMYLADIGVDSYVNAFTEIAFVADNSRIHVESQYIVDSVIKGADRIYALVGGGAYDLEYIPMDSSEMYAKRAAGETIYTSFEILNPDGEIGVEDYALLCMERNRVENALVIPRNALYTEGGSKYVYVMEDGGRVRRDVETGSMAQHLVEIKSGLEEGDVVFVQE